MQSAHVNGAGLRFLNSACPVTSIPLYVNCTSKWPKINNTSDTS